MPGSGVGSTLAVGEARQPGCLGSALARVAVSTPVIALVLVVLAWPVPDLLRPRSDFVDSWPTALVLAIHRGVRWGPGVAYTYGPLGFLRLPTAYFEGTTRLSLLYVAATEFALAASLLYILRRAFGVWLAAALTLLALCLVPDERAAIAAFVWAVVALRDDAPPVARRWFAPAAGALAGLEVLVKVNSGLAVLAIGLVVALASERRLRDLLSLAAGFLGSFLALWLLAGQRLGDLDTYVRGSWEIVRGYPAALGLADGDTTGAVVVAALLVALVLLAARHGVRARPRVMSWAVYPLWAVVAFLVFKEGFVRSDTGHRPIFFGFALCALLAVVAQRAILGRALVATAAAALVAAWSYQGSMLNVPVPGTAFGAIVTEMRTVASPAAGRRQEHRLRARLREAYELDPGTLAALGRRRMTILGEEFAAAYAYRLRWRPLVTIQPSQTYTTWLDERSARMLRSPAGPERILRSPRPTLDHRNAVWDMPAALDAVMCRYAEVSATSRWQVLARRASRCGRPMTRATVRARVGRRIAVPPPRSDAAMLLRIHGAEPAGLEVLQGLAYRPNIRRILVNRHLYRLVPGTAADGLVLWVPPAADYTGAFALSQRARVLAVLAGGGFLGGHRELTYEFVDVPIRPFARPR